MDRTASETNLSAPGASKPERPFWYSSVHTSTGKAHRPDLIPARRLTSEGLLGRQGRVGHRMQVAAVM